jgi:hypothetical protein
MHTLYNIDLVDVLSMGRRLNMLSRTIIHGVQTGKISFSLELTTEVRELISCLLQLIKKEIATLTCPDYHKTAHIAYLAYNIWQSNNLSHMRRTTIYGPFPC